MTRSLLLLWLRISAWVMDLFGRKHNIRRRIGGMTRKKKSGVVESPSQALSDGRGHPAPPAPEVAP